MNRSARAAWLLGLGLAAGCYDPQRPAELPDASVDAPPGLDSDGDGVADLDDDCPALADPAQADFDADGLGDPCDPCPIDAATDDTDGDGVAGRCDPDEARPNTIVRFTSFRAAADAAPAGWIASGAWQFTATGAIATPSMASAATLLTTVDPAAVDLQVTAVFAIASDVATADRAVSVVSQLDGTGGACAFALAASAPPSAASLQRLGAGVEAQQDVAVPFGTSAALYQLRGRWLADTWACAIALGSTDAELTGAPLARGPDVGVRVDQVGARVEALLVVGD